ncbi:hypothetical protein SLS62_004102 [Diatrype stigma]|uniref:beta-glucosidase n=1 Tax=Diatrype stigma TaxID=117547 RepID=A0AAN9UU12_9PEZI
MKATKDLIANGSVELATLQGHVRRILGVKWDLGLFADPFIPSETDPLDIVSGHRTLTLEASQRSIVLLENRNSILPLKPQEQNISRIALIGPFTDVLNYGGYSGQWGQYPAGAACTLRQGILSYSGEHDFELVSGWGANTWEYNAQYVIPPYLLAANKSATGGLLATYFADTNFKQPLVQRLETPALDWGLYPPDGLPSTNFSAIWEGELQSPVDVDVDGWIGVAVGQNTTVKLFIDGELITAHGGQDGMLQSSSNIMSNIMDYNYIQANSTLPPQGAASFTFRKGATYHIRIEYQAFNLYKKVANVVSLNSQLILFWNLVSRNGDAVNHAVQLASSADVVVLAVGAAWNSDGESGDRGTLGLPPSQDILAREIYKLAKPVVLVLQGGRPFAIDYYNQSAAVLSAFFPGQSGGQAIADVLFGTVTPGGRMPVTVPRHVGQLPVYYNYKALAHKKDYLDIDSSPAYWFGYGMSYTDFKVSAFEASSTARDPRTFSSGDTVTFSVTVENVGDAAGSYVVQVYVLSRVSSIVQPERQLVAFQRVDIEAGHGATVTMDLDVDRYLTILNRKNEWELEKGSYTFALLNHGGDTDKSTNVTLNCI